MEYAHDPQKCLLVFLAKILRNVFEVHVVRIVGVCVWACVCVCVRVSAVVCVCV